MEWESDNPCLSHTYPGLGHRSPGKHSSWGLEFGNCRAIPGWRLLLTVERLIKRRWGRKIWWEMPVEESPAAMEARGYCWVMCRGWSHHHSLSLPTCRLQLNNREGGASNTWCTELQSRTPARGPLYVPDALNNREGPQAREPSMCLKWGRYRERLAKEAFWSPAKRGSNKDYDRALTPAAEAVRVPAHLALPGSLQAKQLCHLHAQVSLG